MLHNQHVSFLLMNNDILNIRVKITDILCYIFVIFGVIGNLLGLCIFSSSRRTWRVSSVYVYLATSTSIVNLCCVIRYGLILYSKSQHIISKLVGNIWFACKIYEFSFGFRVISSWITLFWMFERVTCVSKRLRSFFYRWNTSQFKFVLPSIIIIFILICVLGPPVYLFQPQISKNELTNFTIQLKSNYCGINSQSSIKLKKYFYNIHFGLNHYTIRCLFSELIPTVTIILFNICIIYYLIHTSHRFNQINFDEIPKQHKQTTSWMNIVLILHSSLFLLSLFSHIIGHLMSVEAHETWWVLLSVLANCSLNFYVYCLSGKAFRQQIIHFIQKLTTKNFYKLQIYKQQWQQSQYNQKRNQFKTYRRSFRLNSSFRTSKEEESSM